MKIREILEHKGTEVVTVAPQATVLEAMQVLVRHDIGSVVVIRDDEVLGILTERDVLRLGARDPGLLADTGVDAVMSVDVIVGTPEDDIAYCMEVMTNNRVRHLPVMEGRRLCGLVSIGDVVNASRKNAETENRHLKDYIRGAVR